MPDKRVFAGQLEKKAEEAANKREKGAIHKITRRLCGTRQIMVGLRLIVNRRHGGSSTAKVF